MANSSLTLIRLLGLPQLPTQNLYRILTKLIRSNQTLTVRNQLKNLIANPHNIWELYRETLRATNSNPVLTGLSVVILVVLVFSVFCPSIQAQTRTNFTQSDKFSIPELNGTISFAINGSYLSANLENDTWTFNDLRFNITQPLGTLKVSAENSNMTILSYRSFSFFGRNPALRYNAAGDGTQTVNLGLNSTQPTHPSEWTVVAPGNVFLAEGEGWNLLADNTVVLSGITGNISITHIDFGIPNSRNLPFYKQHSIAIITAIVLAITVAIAVVVKFKMRQD